MKIIDFYADWCGPCKVMSGILDKLQTKYKDIEIEKIDVDADPESSDDYKVRSIPTLIFVNDDDVIVHKHTGYLSLEKIENIMEKY